MPTFLGCSFLRSCVIESITLYKLCQCPLSWATHFYIVGPVPHNVKKMCQCPLSWATHFYSIMQKTLDTTFLVCQCPLSWATHFYEYTRKEPHFTSNRCQCPLSWATHFYVNNGIDFNHSRHMCQCPLSWATHFYYLVNNMPGLEFCCVNAHFLGLLISTLPLKIPSIYAAYRACFCGYFSEYSDSSPKKGSKVGRRRIVFLRYNFFYVIC